MKQLFLGNAAVARGAYEAGVRVVSSYPGTPSTEITEEMVRYSEVDVEWAPNEKVAAEVAVGASLANGRAMSCMKHVGLNVMADPVFTASYLAPPGGLVFCVADDPGMHSSQNEQDSRHYAKAAKIMMLEPSDAEECRDFARDAFELSEKFHTPVFLRLSTRVSHSQGLVEPGEVQVHVPGPYVKNAQRVAVPVNSRKMHVEVEKRTEQEVCFAENCAYNRIENHGSRIGVITSGISYMYAREALGDQVNYLKLGIVYPLPEELIRNFAAQCECVYVIEELDPFLEEHCRALGVDVRGKELFTPIGEYNADMISRVVLGRPLAEHVQPLETRLPARPPVMCAGCPHRGVFYVLAKLGLHVAGDIGCYTLGANAPLNSMDFNLCMGASIGTAFGMVKAQGREFGKKVVSVIGDSTFIHSGITGLIDIVYNQGNNTILILDNSTTGMTGHQDNPTTGRTIRGIPTRQVDLELLCKAVGVTRVKIVDPFDVELMEKTLREELEADEPSVIISQRPCALLKSVRYQGKFRITEDCRKCRRCMKLGCPAITCRNGVVSIDPLQCVGCGLCEHVCPFGAMVREENT